jgi:aminopeptidase N
MTARGAPEDVARAAAHFQNARNHTDEIAGLANLIDLRTPERAEALQRFYDRWQHDHLVIDAWFAFQAASALPGTLGVVEKLTRHPLFSITNPNKVRAVVATFASNQVAFHRPDGKGYAFIADRVLELDRFNPQIAARLASVFRTWRTLESGRRKLARKALQRIARTEGLSRDVSEIVSKTLD